MMKISLLVSLLCLGCFAFAQSSIDLTEPEVLQWPNDQPLWRIYADQQYYFVDHTGKVVINVNKYKSAQDFYQGYARVQAADNRYGLINESGANTIACEWDYISQHQNGYVLIAQESRKKVKEDRGEGKRKYRLLTYQLARTDGKIFDLKFKEASLIGVILRGTTEDDQEIKIDTALIRDWYSHPLLKAITDIDNQPVNGLVQEDEVVFLEPTNKELLSLKVPELK